jgi:hypothetical protein
MRRMVGWVFMIALFCPWEALAHHGGVSLPFGPGTPIETASPLTLPQGGVVLYTRAEQVEWRKFQFAEPTNKDSFTFFSLGGSYGITPYLTASFSVPYNIKRQDSLGSNSGIGDIRFSGILGFHHEPGQGFKLNTAKESAISLEKVKKTFFTLYGGFTIPTGKSHEELGGKVDPSMQPGFGSPSFTIGMNAGRALFRSLSFVVDASADIFTRRDDFKFGNEYRFNLAAVQELYGKSEKFIAKIDGILEGNLLYISRDEQGAEGLRATGGTILYITPGMRFSFPRFQNANLGIAVKIPVYRNLNEQDEQQGSEGLEKYRAIVTLSFYF